MASFAQWLEGARPRTLPAAVAPVAVGTGAAAALSAASAPRAVLCLVVSLALQVGVNYANDYSDGVRGTDRDRVGPLRLVGSGVAPPRTVLTAALASFAVAGLAGLALTVLARAWWMPVVGAASIAAAWTYTGGRRPYGYRALGEVGVFVFFGLVAVLGTTYVQAGRLSWAALAGAVGVGAYACAILVANNLRDIPGDRVEGKRTLAVVLGDPRTRRLWLGLVGLAHALGLSLALGHPWTLLSLAGALPATRAAWLVLGGATGGRLVPVLRDTGLGELCYALGLGLGLTL